MKNKKILSVLLSIAMVATILLTGLSAAELTAEAAGPFTTVPMVSAGSSHTVGLRSNGTVATAGSNEYNKCSGTSSWTDVVAVEAGPDHTVGLMSDGTVKAVGRSDYPLCNTTGWTNIVAVAAGNLHTVGLKKDGTVAAVGDNSYSQRSAPLSWYSIVAIAAGDNRTLGVKSDGTVVMAGYDSFQQKEKLASWRSIVAVSVGALHTVGLKQDGTVVAAGATSDGQCMVENTSWKNIVAVSAGGYHTVGLKKDGTVVTAGSNSNGQRTGVDGWTNIVSVSAGYNCTVGLKRDGTLVVAGTNNTNGNLTLPWNLGYTPILPDAVKVSPASKTLNIGKTVQLSATITPSTADDKSVTWSTSNSKLATVNQSGKVTAKAVGTATITVRTTSGNKIATCKITVNPTLVTKITLSNTAANMIVGNTRTLKATVAPADATDQSVTWSSSNTKVAKVNQSGKVTAVGAGNVTIKATAKDESKKSASATITVHQYVTMRIGKTTAIMNGTKTYIDDVGTKPFKISGKTMLPLRFVGEKMGGKVNYISDSQPITLSYGNTKVEFRLGNKQMKIITGSTTQTVTLEVPAQKVGGKTYIPLRAIGQALGFDVYYEAGTEYIVVNNPKMTPAVKNARLSEAKKVIQ